jgi:16S rRNA pseudouridine516 synthase
MRIDRVVSSALGVKLARARELVSSGCVCVDGEIVKVAQYQVFTWLERVEVQGEVVVPPTQRILMVNKPSGVTSLAKTNVPGQQSVMDLVPTDLQHSTLGIYGRLDVSTTGLLLLGTDGGIGQLLTHPSSEITKQYVADMNRDNEKWALCDDAEARFAVGLVLADGTACQPAQLLRLPNHGESAEQVRVCLHEGKYHQVKKMLGACGGYVHKLHRDWIGSLNLDERLQLGEVRELTEHELVLVHKMLPKCKRMLPRRPVAVAHPLDPKPRKDVKKTTLLMVSATTLLPVEGSTPS